MNNGFKQIAGIAVTSIALSMAAQAFAQSNAKVRASGWFKTCNQQGENKICNVQFQVVTNTGQVVTGVSLVNVTGKITRGIFRVIVPTARSLTQGLQVQVDKKQATTIPYSFCRPTYCVAEANLNDELVKVFKNGGQLDVTTINYQGTPNPVPVTLTGFTAAYDGDPVERAPNSNAAQAPADSDGSATQSEEDKLKQQLQEKLKANQN